MELVTRKKQKKNREKSLKVFPIFSGHFFWCCSLPEIGVFGWTRCSLPEIGRNWPWHNPPPTFFSGRGTDTVTLVQWSRRGAVFVGTMSFTGGHMRHWLLWFTWLNVGTVNPLPVGSNPSHTGWGRTLDSPRQRSRHIAECLSVVLD